MSDRTVAAKLLIKPGAAVWVSAADRAALLGPLPDGVALADAPAPGSVAIVFADDAASTRAAFDAHRDALGRAAVVWVAYPKGGRTDISRDSLWPILAGYGFRPIGQVAIDATWSALRFRLLAPGEAPFTGGR